MILLLAFSCKSNDDIVPDVDPGPVGPPDISVIHDEFEGTSIVLAGSPVLNFIVAYNREHDGKLLSFEAINDELPLIMSDDEGNRWDIFGAAKEGPRTGEQLTPLNSGMGYWFAFSSFYPGAYIYDESPIPPPSVDGPAEDWLISTTSVVTVVGFDGIPALDSVNFVNVDPKDDLDGGFYVENQDLVIAVKNEADVRVYPHPILNWHEIINDRFNDKNLTVTFCPLTGTSKVYDTSIASENVEFGVSGLLYNNNLIMFDRETFSLWTQIGGESVTGPQIGASFPPYPHIETTWKTMRLIKPNADIVSTDTGISKSYDEDPYQIYKTTEDVLFPLDYVDERIPLKERVYGIVLNDKIKVYRYTHFNE